MSEEIKKAVSNVANNPLVQFAVGAGSATIVVATCWAVVQIVKMLFA